MFDERQMLTVKQVAGALGITPTWLYQLIKADRSPIPCTRISERSIRFSPTLVNEYLRGVRT